MEPYQGDTSKTLVTYVANVSIVVMAADQNELHLCFRLT